MFQSLPHISQFENFLFLIVAQSQVSGNRIGQTTRVFDAAKGSQHLRGYLGIKLDVLLELGRHRAHQDLSFTLVEIPFSDRCRVDNKTFFGFNVVDDSGAGDPLHQYLHGAVRQLQQLQDIGNRPDAENILWRRIIVRRVVLGRKEDLFA